MRPIVLAWSPAGLVCLFLWYHEYREFPAVADSSAGLKRACL